MKDPTPPNIAAINLTKAKRGRKAVFTEVGRSGYKRSGGLVVDEFLTELRGLQGVRVYREMRDNDPVVGAALYAIEQVVRKVSWFIDPFDSTQESKRQAEFLSENMNDMSHTWNEFITEIGTCKTYGWAWFEQTNKLRKGDVRDGRLRSKYTDGLVGWRKIALRAQSTLVQWDFDDEGGIRGMTQNPPPDYDNIYIPIEKSLLFRARVEGNNPEGRSLLRNAYREWYFKKNIEEIEAIGIERDLIGIPVVYAPPEFDIDADDNSDVVSGVNKILANLRRDEQEGLFFPDGWKISLLSGEHTTRRQFDLDKVINRKDKRIASTVLAQFIMLGMDRVGSFALSKNQNDLFLIAVQGYLDSITEILNHFAVPRLFALNPSFNADMGKLPKFVPGKVTEPNLAELADYINVLASNELLVATDDVLRELHRVGGFSEPNDRRLGALNEREATGRLVSEAQRRARAVEDAKNSQTTTNNGSNSNN